MTLPSITNELLEELLSWAKAHGGQWVTPAAMHLELLRASPLRKLPLLPQTPYSLERTLRILFDPMSEAAPFAFHKRVRNGHTEVQLQMKAAETKGRP